LFFNIANSSYYGVVIETDRIIEEKGSKQPRYTINEIRFARKLKSSVQQSKGVSMQRESVFTF
jgi:hypothetical protein